MARPPLTSLILSTTSRRYSFLLNPSRSPRATRPSRPLPTPMAPRTDSPSPTARKTPRLPDLLLLRSHFRTRFSTPLIGRGCYCQGILLSLVGSARVFLPGLPPIAFPACSAALRPPS